MKALIIGGGIGGLMAAIALRKAGLDVAVFERAPELREVGAGITLWANAARVLRQLGVGPSVEAVSTPLTQAEIRNWRGKLLAADDLGRLGEKLGAPSVGVHRADLQRELAKAAGPEVVRLGRECVGFAADSEGVTARFADGSEERGDLLIGADGLHSRIRSQLLGDEKPRYAGYTAWRGVGLIDHPAVPLRLTLLAVGRGSQFGILPIGQGRTYWFATMNTPAGGSQPPEEQKRFLLERYRDWYAPVPAVIEATDAAAIIRNDVYDRPPVRRWGEGRVTLLGDAAHPTTPNMGQGACQAIEDALVLGRCLAGAADVPAALRSYESQRYERTAFVTNQSWKFGKLLGWENRFACALRDWLIRQTQRRTQRQNEAFVGAEI